MNEEYRRWRQLTWGDLATLEYGKGLRGYQEAVAKYPVYGTNGLIGWHDTALCKKAGIIIGRKGAYRGVHLSKTPFFVFDTAFYLNLLSDNVDLIWAYYQLINFDINKLDSGSAIPSTSREAFYQIPISLPPLPTQRKIAAILSAYDDLIENNTRRIAIREEMAQSLYRDWFMHFGFPGHEKKSMVESALGMIPEGWEVAKLRDIAREVRRTVNPESIDPETPYFGLEHLPRKSIALADWGTAKEVQSTKLAFNKGEILFGKIRPYFHKVGIATLDGVCSSDTIVIVPRDEQYFAMVLGCVSSEDFVNYATKTSQGTKMPRANWDVLVQYHVVVPAQPILNRFNELIKDIVVEIQNIVFRNRNLRQTRDLLLPKLISGEVDVEELEIAGVEETGEVEAKEVKV